MRGREGELKELSRAELVSDCLMGAYAEINLHVNIRHMRV